MPQEGTQTEGFNPFRRLGCDTAEGGLVLLSFLTLITVLPIILYHEGLCDHTTICNKTYGADKVDLTHKALNRSRRYVTTGNEEWLTRGALPHHYAVNSWWRYAKWSAKQKYNGSCYVCSHMPHSTAGPSLRVRKLTDSHSRCLMALSVHPGVGKRWNAANFSIPLNLSGLPSPIAGGNCSSLKDYLAWPQVVWKMPSPVVLKRNMRFGVCVVGKGTNNLGQLGRNQCDSVLCNCPPVRRNKCFNCLSTKSCANNHSVVSDVCAKNQSHAIPLPWNKTLTANCSGVVPTSRFGTRVLSDWYWLCGTSVYSALPDGWTGVCSLIALYDPTFVIPDRSTFEHLKQHVPRARRSIASPNSVPETHRIWSSGEKVMQGMFPWVGIGEVHKEIEITRYTLLQYINSSILTDASIRTELTAGAFLGF